MSLKAHIPAVAAAAALLTATPAFGDADLTSWHTADDAMRIEQQVPRPDATRAPMSHWRPFFLPADNAYPAASTRDRRNADARARQTKTRQTKSEAKAASRDR